MGTYSYFSFTETAEQAFKLTEHLNDEPATDYQVYGVHYVLKLTQPIMAFEDAINRSNLNHIMANYAIAWSGQTAAYNAAGDHAKHTMTLDDMIDDLGMSGEWATNPQRFGTIIDREQLAAEAGVELKPETVLPEPNSPSPSPDYTTPEGLALLIAIEIDRQFETSPGYLDADDLTEATVDGHVDLLAVANVVLAKIGGAA